MPTMGALHDGHISLVRESLGRGNATLVSIFVNPTQFNNPSDLDKYPRDEDGDVAKLKEAGCNAVFVPQKSEVYPNDYQKERYQHDFGELEKRLEGAFRPGHFRGVGEVVHILFELVKPDEAFFGEKDFQQLMVIRKLVDMTELNVKIYGVKTMREADGLAMSSRNLRLTDEQRKQATLLFKALTFAKSEMKYQDPDSIRQKVKEMFESDPIMELEYFDLVNSVDLSPIDSETDPAKARAVIAAYAGEIRLIDNMALL